MAKTSPPFRSMMVGSYQASSLNTIFHNAIHMMRYVGSARVSCRIAFMALVVVSILLSFCLWYA